VTDAPLQSMSNERKHQLERADDPRLPKKPKLMETDDSTPHALPPAPSPVPGTAPSTDQPSAAAQISTEEDHKRKQEELKRIELEFTALKEKLFADKMAAIKKEIDQLNDGSHDGYLGEVKLLDEKKRRRYLLAEQWRNYSTQCVDISLEGDKKAADDEFETEATELKERMQKNLQKRRKQAEEEKRDFSLGDTTAAAAAAAAAAADPQRASTRTLRKRGAKDNQSADGSTNGLSDSKKPTVPEIRATLTEEEIESDIAAIQRALTVV